MDKKKEVKKDVAVKLLLAVISLLLTGIFGMFLIFIDVARETKTDMVKSQNKTTEAVNNSRITQAVHSEQIEDNEQKNLFQDAAILQNDNDIKKNKFEIKEVKKRVHILED
jgi:hypothetical protein